MLDGGQLEGVAGARQSPRCCEATSGRVTPASLLPCSSLLPSITNPHVLLVLAHSPVSKVCVAPRTVYNPLDGHLPLHHYQSGVKCLLRQFSVPPALLYISMSCQLLFPRWTMQTPAVVKPPQHEAQNETFPRSRISAGLTTL